jgi:hypothetical protein
MKRLCFFLMMLVLLFLFAGCMTERERRGVNYAPFNAPEGSPRRTFDGDM